MRKIPILVFAALSLPALALADEAAAVAGLRAYRDIVWPGGKKAAFYLSFDDGCASQPKNVFPLLAEYRVHGTFYVCPGWDSFKNNEAAWAAANPYVHLGNHTYSHGDFSNLVSFVEQVRLCNEVIRRLTPAEPWPRPVAFGIPGTETLAKMLPGEHPDKTAAALKANDLVVRLLYHGYPVDCKTIPEMEAYIDRVVAEGGVGHLDFHGVGGDWLDPGMEYFTAVLKKLDSVRERLHFAPFEELDTYARAQRAERRRPRLALARRTAAEGIVLLKNDGAVLPLRPGKPVALLGFSAYFPHRMGWGSGDMMDHVPTPLDVALERAGVGLDGDFAKLYRDELRARQSRGEYARVNLDWWKWTSRFDELDLWRERFDEVAKGKRGETCIVVIGRASGESVDVPEGPGGYRFHWQEQLLVEQACRNFDDVILVFNGHGVIDLSVLDTCPVKAFVFAPLMGEVTGDAIADVLTGAVNPSGKTVDTWAKRYCDYSTTDCFGTMELPYSEGVFVGYRHFVTAGVEPRFPFGFGLSYTTFEIEPLERGEAKVTNTGKVAGREVVQCYVAAPDGKLAQPKVKLCSFAKTRVLRPGESEIVRLSTDLETTASWCEVCGKWALEAGRYRFLVGDSVASLKDAWTEDLAEKRLWGGAVKVPAAAELPRPTRKVVFADVVAGTATAEELVAEFDDVELALMLNGRVFDEGFAVDGGTGVGGVKSGKVTAEAGEFWSSEKYGIPAIACADGPSGVRLGNFNDPKANYNPICAELVQWPSGTCLAQTWDLAAAEAFGRAVAGEMAAAGIDGWLAPGVNIHRNPLCGRNFEYFSEDPLLSGKMGAAVVRGVQTTAEGKPSGRYATVKHFCTNNQEFERGAEMNRVSERALREIYLKPFEIVVKESQPVYLMSSYNRLNGDYVATTRKLLTDVLRGEWGFEGAVMTDWWNSADKLRHPVAGNDVVMAGTRKEVEALIAALRDGRVARADAQACAVRMVKAIARLVRK